MLQINASIASHKGKIYCSYRTCHLFQFDSESYITDLDENLEPVCDKRLIAGNNNTAFEDVRLFSFGEHLMAFYSYFPFDGKDKWKWEFGVGCGIVNIATGTIEQQTSLRSASKRIHEKNWVPYSVEDELYMVTDFDPFLRIIKIDASYKAEEIYLASEQTKGWEYGEIRGGTPLLRSPDPDDEWRYGFVHSYIQNYQGFNRYYYFTAVRYHHQLKKFEYHPEPLTYPEKKTNAQYELLWQYSNNRTVKVIFPIGIMHYKKGVLVSFGKDDVTSCTRYYSWNKIFKLFKQFKHEKE